jgi:single-strand DNA-binding protein
MAGNLNKVFLVGNLTRDPELRHTAQGTSVANFSIAVNRSYKGNDGDFKKEVSYFNIVVWGKTGENCSKYLSKGRSVLVEGRLANRSYETQDGQKRTITEIVADNVQFLGGRGDSQDEGGETSSGGGDYGSNYADGSDDDAVPF